MTKLVICRGVPASGKTTYAMEWLSADPDRARVNRDDIRYANFGRGYGIDEQLVTVLQNTAIEGHLKAGRDTIVDNTNLRARDFNSIREIGLRLGAEIEIKDFPASLSEAIERDSKRERRVGREVICSFFDRYIRNGQLPPIPELPEKMNFKRYVPDTSLPPAFGFDLDGTLAHMDGKRGPYDTHLYHVDRVDETLKRLANFLGNGYSVIILSGRSEDYRQEVTAWLARNDVWYDELIMRKSGDTRRDDIVKSELFDEFIAPRYNFLMQFDDRDRVVAGLRSKGVMVAQVAEGNF